MDQRRARATLATSCSVHFLHDGFSDLLFVLFPVWAREFALSFTQVGSLRTGYSGALALFQLPAGFLAERWGETPVLVAGTLLTAVGYLFLGTAGSFPVLLAFLLLGGLGAGTQHPLASSLVARAYEEGPRRVALGTYNFSGDLGKVVWPTLVAAATAWVGWRWAVQGVGLVALAGAAGILLVLPHLAPSAAKPPQKDPPAGSSGWGIQNGRGFRLLSVIHGIDNGSRSAFMTFLPFLLLSKGAGMDLMGIALGITFAGGAAGKFACGAIAERVGVIRTVILTEAATGLGILLLLGLPLQPTLILLPVLGLALNGTSSVLYGTVPEFVLPEKRSRAYGLFYTVGIGAGALAPPAFGLISDLGGLRPTLTVLAVVVLFTVPLARQLRRAMTQPGC